MGLLYKGVRADIGNHLGLYMVRHGMYACMYVCMYACMHVYAYVYVYVYIYIHMSW